MCQKSTSVVARTSTKVVDSDHSDALSRDTPAVEQMHCSQRKWLGPVFTRKRGLGPSGSGLVQKRLQYGHGASIEAALYSS